MKTQARHRLTSNEDVSEQREHKQNVLVESMGPQPMLIKVVLAIECLIAEHTHVRSRKHMNGFDVSA